MNIFEEQLLRLKQAVKVTTDQEAAALLGMTKAAFSDRKKRESFPTKEVFALASQRPELDLDPDWVVTGAGTQVQTDSKSETALLECYRLLSKRDKAVLLKVAVAMSDVVNLSGDEIARRLGAASSKKQ